MPTFAYRAVDEAGTRRRGSEEGATLELELELDLDLDQPLTTLRPTAAPVIYNILNTAPPGVYTTPLEHRG